MPKPIASGGWRLGQCIIQMVDDVAGLRAKLSRQFHVGWTRLMARKNTKNNRLGLLPRVLANGK
ncbi:hypothetical protein ACQW02_27745 [Humitalea sp. 24SJ18S-53]|uniref:hypothetical protein n=1 Tax=Humitalea sp. 24SJ18S-53 TaxID=3422307 RepID=UPI003D67568A